MCAAGRTVVIVFRYLYLFKWVCFVSLKNVLVFMGLHLYVFVYLSGIIIGTHNCLIKARFRKLSARTAGWTVMMFVYAYLDVLVFI